MGRRGNPNWRSRRRFPRFRDLISPAKHNRLQVINLLENFPNQIARGTPTIECDAFNNLYNSGTKTLEMLGQRERIDSTARKIAEIV